MKRFLAVLLCLLMCVSMLPVAAFAEVADIVNEDDEGNEGEQQCTHDNIMYVPREEPGCKGGHIDYYKCSDCGKLFSDVNGDEEISLESTQLSPKHTKPADEKLIKTIPATCTEKGQVKYRCAICGDDVTEYQKKLEHQLVIHPYVAQTCTTDGNYTYYSCDRCGKLYWNEKAEYAIDLSDIVIPKGHSLTHVEAITPTCTADGNIEYYTCSTCGKLYADETAAEEITDSVVLQALDHSLVKVDAKSPTCAEDGNVEYWVCLHDGCNAIFEDEIGSIPTSAADVVVSKTTVSHTLIKVGAKETSCEEAGNLEYWKCEVCGRLFSDNEGQTETNAETVTIPALPHQLEKTVAQDATCLEDGNIDYWTCSECKKTFSDAAATTAIQQADTVIAHGHQLEKMEAKAATCSEDGNIQYWVCKRENCGKVFSDAEGTREIQLADTVVTKVGHIFDGGICQVCRVEDPDYKGPTLKDPNLNIISGEELVIRVDADFDTTMAKNWSITIDGETISKDFIDVSRGSTVFTINGDALKKLAPGKYKVTIKIDEETVEAELVVEEEPTKYDVIIDSIKNGKVTVDKATAAEGETITLTVSPNSGYILKKDSLSVKNKSTGSGITVTNNQFKMPAADVMVTADFVKEFTVKFDTVLPVSTVTKPAEKKVLDGDTIAVSDMPEPEDSAKHHEFKGWYKDQDYKTPFKAGTDIITADTTLYAKWTHDYPHDKKDALEGKGICPYCWEADHSFTTGVIDPDFAAEIVRGNGKTAHYGSYFPMTVNTYYRYVKDSVVVKVDGKTLSTDHFNVFSPKNGTSTIVELDRAYIRKLPVGKYAISIKTDLGTARGFFWVSSSPKTGDDSNVALWVTVGVISAAAAAGIAYYLIKKRRK